MKIRFSFGWLLLIGVPMAICSEPVTVDQIHEHSRRWNKKQVRVQGEIEDVRGSHSFVLEGAGSLLDDEILILSQEPLPRLNEDQIVVVTGIVRRLDREGIERELAIELDPAIEVEMDRKRELIVADSIQIKKPGAD